MGCAGKFGPRSFVRGGDALLSHLGMFCRGDNRYAGNERGRAEVSIDLTEAEKAESSGRVRLVRSGLRCPLRDDLSGEAKAAVDRGVSHRLLSPLGSPGNVGGFEV